MIGDDAADLRQLPLIEALWLAIKRRDAYDPNVLEVLKERYRLEYELREIK